MNKKIRSFLLLIAILVLAFLLRVWQINQNPPSLNWDEVSHGYNAYSILKTSKDEWGVAFPIIFRAYGDYKLPLYVYTTAVSESIFGLNEFAVRLPSLLAGILSVLFIFLLVKRIFKNDSLAILAALLLAMEPWSIFLSRIAVEANLSAFLIITAIYFLVLSVDKKWFLLISFFLFGLSLHTYNSARIFVPLFIVSLGLVCHSSLVEWIKKRKLVVFSSALVFIFFFLPMIGQMLSGEGGARYRWVNLLDEGAINKINEARGKSSLPIPLPKMVYNKVTYYTFVFSQNYISHFSPNFLFLKGGSNYQFNVSGLGLLYPLELPFVVLGLFILLKKRNKFTWVILSWLLLAPIPGSLTRDAPHTLRAIIFLPVFSILTSLGIWSIWDWLKAKAGSFRFVLAVIYFLLTLFLLKSFWQVYTTSYRTDYSWSWQYGYKEVVFFLKENHDKYDKIIVTKKYGEPHEFILFWWPWNPNEFQNDQNLVRYFRTDWYWVDSFGKFNFINDWEVKQKITCSTQKEKCLLVTSPNNYPEGWNKIKTINFLDGKPAFEILEQ